LIIYLKIKGMRKPKTVIFISLLLEACLISSSLLYAQSEDWPFLKHYDQDHVNKIALPVGGIGTGTISLGGIGDLRDWEIMNKPAKGFVGTPTGNRAPFFAIYVKPEGQSSITRALMGPIDINQYENKEGRGPNSHGLPRFRQCTFDAAYPFGQVNLSDPDIPS
jgi:non-lysosomal glucosylceramidase